MLSTAEVLRFEPDSDVLEELEKYKHPSANAGIYANCFHTCCLEKAEYLIGLPLCKKHAISTLTHCIECGKIMPKMHDYGRFLNHDTETWVCYDCASLLYDKCFYCGGQKKQSDLICGFCLRDRDVVAWVTALNQIDCEMALIIMEYYSILAREVEWGGKLQFKVTPAQTEAMARYFTTTVAAELRHAPCIASLNREDYHCLRILNSYCELKYDPKRIPTMANFLEWCPSIYDAMVFLRSAYAAFNSETWPKAFGGPCWAYCSWRSLLLLSELHNNNGVASRLTWEMCLNACHNNSRWLNKLGQNTYFVLVMGSTATPKQILDIYYASDPIEAVRAYGRNKQINNNVNNSAAMPPVDTIWSREFIEEYGDNPKPRHYDELKEYEEYAEYEEREDYYVRLYRG